MSIKVYHAKKNPALPRFSASQTKKWLQCPAAWFYSRLQPWGGNQYAALGNEVHSRLERWQEGKPDAPDDVNVCKRTDVVPYLTKEHLQRAEIMAKAVRAAFPGPGPGVTPEKWFTITVEPGAGKPFQLSGLMDTEHVTGERSLEVLDLKTTGNWAYALKADDMPGDPQCVIYANAAFAEYSDLETVTCRWVYAHTKNKKKILGPQPQHTFSRASAALAFRALYDICWLKMIEFETKKRAPRGNAPDACTQYRNGCEFDVVNGGPCKQHQKIHPAFKLLTWCDDAPENA